MRSLISLAVRKKVMKEQYMQVICAADAFIRNFQQLISQTSKQPVAWQAHSSGLNFLTNKEASLFHVAREDFNIAM